MTTTRTAEERAEELVRRYEREAAARGFATVVPTGADGLLRELVTDLVDDLTAEIDRLRRGGV